VGLLIGQLLEAAGCHVLASDLDADRVQLARELGAEAACEAASLEAAAESFTGGHGLDAVILAAASRSAEPVEIAGRISRERGRVVVVGAFPLEIPRRAYYEKELTLTVSRAFGAGTYDPNYAERGRDYPYSYVRWTAGRHLEEFLAQLARGRLRVEPLVTHRFPIERAEDAYRLLGDATARPLGILFTYDVEKPLARGPVPASAAPASAPATGELRIGVIGAGKFAQTYLLPHLRRRGVRLHALATATSASAAHLRRKFGFSEAGCDAEALVADPRTNCLVIATRHDLHAHLAAAGLEASKWVFVEKPLALNEEELREVMSAARDHSGRLLVGFNRRFSPLGRRVKEFFAGRQGPLVMTYRVNAAALPADHWVYDPVEGGGRIRSELCHFIDLLQYLAGAPPIRVYAESIRPASDPRRTDENVQVTLHFSDGSTGTITYTTVGDPRVARERIEIFGEQAAAEINNFRTAHLHRRHRTRRFWLLQQDMGYRDEMSAFLEAAATGRPLPMSLKEIGAASLATLRVLDSLARRVPVEIDASEI
jgi:predicted dehydrogenase